MIAHFHIFPITVYGINCITNPTIYCRPGRNNRSPLQRAACTYQNLDQQELQYPLHLDQS